MCYHQPVDDLTNAELDELTGLTAANVNECSHPCDERIEWLARLLVDEVRRRRRVDRERSVEVGG